MVFTCLYGNDQRVFVHVRHFLFACGKLPVHCKGSAGRRCGYGIFEEGISDERIAEIGSLIEKRAEVSHVNFVSADAAWESFKDDYLGEYADGFGDDNPLRSQL